MSERNLIDCLRLLEREEIFLSEQERRQIASYVELSGEDRWRLTEPIDWLDVSALANRFDNFFYQDQLTSTQLALKQNLVKLDFNSQPNSSYWQTCEYQAAGVGRQSRSWGSWPARSLTLSYGLHITKQQRERAQLFSLYLSYELAKIWQSSQAEIKIKWPNDLLQVKDGLASSLKSTLAVKIAGILCEMYKVNQADILLVGLGVNWHNPADAQIDSGLPLGDLRDHLLALAPSRTEIWLQCAGSILRAQARWADGEADDDTFMQAYKSLHYYQPGDMMWVHDVQGNRHQQKLVDITTKGIWTQVADSEIKLHHQLQIE